MYLKSFCVLILLLVFGSILSSQVTIFPSAATPPCTDCASGASNLTTPGAVVIVDTPGSVTQSSITNTILLFLSNVTSDIQAQLNARWLTADVTTTPTANKVPQADGSNKLAAGWVTEVLALVDLSDVSSKNGTSSVVQMFNGAAPDEDDCAKFDVDGNIVSAGAPCGSGSGTPPYDDTFTSQDPLVIAAGTHGLGTNCQWNPQIYTVSSNLLTKFYPGTYSCDRTTGEVTFDFPSAMSGRVMLIPSGGGSGGGSGTVTSVALSVPSFLSVGGSPITTSGTLAVSLATQSANVIFAGPTSGGAAAPDFRALVAADIPTLAYSKIDAADRQGNGVKVQMFGGGSVSTNDCAKFDSNGNIVSAGAACGSGGGSFSAGSGIDPTQLASNIIAVDEATIPTYLDGSGSNNYGTINAGTCGAFNISVTGAMTGETVSVGVPSSLAGASWHGSAMVSAADTVKYMLCNGTGSNADPGGDMTFTVRVHKVF